MYVSLCKMQNRLERILRALQGILLFSDFLHGNGLILAILFWGKF